MNFNHQRFQLPQNQQQVYQQQGGFPHQMQQAQQWHGQMQQNAPSQFYAQNMAMPQQHPMQNAEGQVMNFQHFQRVPENLQSQPASMPNQVSTQPNQDNARKQQFVEQQRKLKEISSRGFRAKSKDGRNLVEDFLSKTDLNLSSGTQQKSKAGSQFQKNVPVPKENAQNVKGYQAAGQDSQTPGFFSQPNYNQVTSHFDISYSSSSQNTNAGSFQSYQSSSVFGHAAIKEEASSPKDDFGDFQGGFGSSQPSQITGSSSSFPSLATIQTSTTNETFSQHSLFDANSLPSMPPIPQDESKGQHNAFDASFLNLSLQITGKQFDFGSTSQAQSSSIQEKEAPGINMNASMPMHSVGDIRESKVVGQSHIPSEVNDYGNFAQTSEIQEEKDPNSAESLYGCKLPTWCYESQNLPAVYKKVLERSLALDGSIDTNKLHSLLLASNVSKDKLKDIWSMANKRTPGVLVEEELNVVLGLIALAQAGWSKLSILKLVSSNSPPIPEFPEYLFMDTEKESVFGGEAISTDDWSSLRSESPVDPTDKYSVFKSYEKARSASVTSVERRLSTSSKESAEWSIGVKRQPITETDSDWANFQTADDGNDVFSTSSANAQFAPVALQPNMANEVSKSIIHSTGSIKPQFAPISMQSDIANKASIPISLSTGSINPQFAPVAMQPDIESQASYPTSSTNLQFAPAAVQSHLTMESSKPIVKSEPSFHPSVAALSDGFYVTKNLSQPANSGLHAFSNQEELAKFSSIDFFQTGAATIASEADDDFGDFQTTQQSNTIAQPEFQAFKDAAGKQEDTFSKSAIPTSNVTTNELEFDADIFGKIEQTTATSIEDFKTTSKNIEPSSTMDDSWDDFASFSDASHSATANAYQSNVSGSFFTASFSNAASVDAQKQIVVRDLGGDFNNQGSTDLFSQDKSIAFTDFGNSASVEGKHQSFEPSDDLFTVASVPSTVSKGADTSMPSNFGLVDHNVNDFFSQKQNPAAEIPSFGNIEQKQDLFTAKTDNNDLKMQKSEIFQGFEKASFRRDAYHQVDQDSLLGSFAKPFSNDEQIKVKDAKQMVLSDLNIGQDTKESGFTEPVLEAENRYKALSGVLEDSDRHVHEWKRFLSSVMNVFNSAAAVIKANNLSLKSKTEVFESEKGKQFFNGLKEIFAVTCRVKISIENSAFAKTNEEIKSCLQKVDFLWREICAFTSGLPQYALPESSKKLDTSNTDVSANSLCGLCLLNVDAQPIELNGCTISAATLTYGGRTYHSTCANFWCNKVNPVLPSLPPLISGLL